MVGGKYMYETWADKESGKQAFTTSTKNSNMGLRNVQLPGLPPMIRCDAKVFWYTLFFYKKLEYLHSLTSFLDFAHFLA